MREKWAATLCLIVLFLTQCDRLHAKIRPDSALLNRIFNYASGIDTAGLTGTRTYTYRRFNLNVKRRNFTLLPVPTMYRIAHGCCREYVGEDYNQVTFKSFNDLETQSKICLSTIPRRRQVMTPALKYLMPRIYNISVFDGYILSPFHIKNRRFYRYSTILLFDGTAMVIFKAKVDNTQLVNGSVTVDYATGRIIGGEIEGEYDMSRFHLTLTMGDEGTKSLLPQKSSLNMQFKFIGNNIAAHYKEYYDQPQQLPDSVVGCNDRRLMEAVRPDTLSLLEQGMYEKYDAEIADSDSAAVTRKKPSKFKQIMWDVIGYHVINRIRYTIGPKDQGYFRLNPILNPLYMGYSNRRGFYYKFDLRGAYSFSPLTEINIRFKGGYSFKQKQFYIWIPFMLYWNKKRNGYLQIEARSGDRIFSTSVRQDVLETPARDDTIEWSRYNLDEFTANSLVITNNYDISDHFGVKVGLALRDHHGFDRNSFILARRPTKYKSVAPSAELEYRPLGWKGPIFTLDYERSFKRLMGSNIAYEKWEMDGQYIHRLASLQSLSFRVGAGLYTRKEKNYFLDYTNFRENNIPGGWNDEYSGEFETLNSDWYNTSNYYARMNMTYESPLLITSRIPLVGHFIEMERLYFSALSVKKLGPYFEIGYGFTTRLFSMHIFTSNNRGRFRDIEFKFGLELFRDW